MSRNWYLWAGAALLLVACSGEDVDRRGISGGESAGGRPVAEILADREAENPDRGRWRDLSAEPFDPTRVRGTLVVGYKNPPATLNNLLWRNDSGRAYMKHYLAPFLLEETPDAGEDGIVARPCVAASLPTASADGLTYRWTIRGDLTWSDGRPLTADDYEFTWNLMQDPAVRCDKRRGSLTAVEKVTKTGPLTFDVRFKERHYNAAVMFGLEFTVVPAHASPTDPEAFNVLRQQVGYGPYRVEEFSDQRLLLTLRDEYREAPFPIWNCYVENVEFRFVPDDAARLEQLRQGEVDIAAIPSGQFEAMGRDPTFNRHNWRTAYPLPNYEFVAWNTRDPEDLSKPHPLFGSAAVRRAVARLVDRQHIAKQVRHGLARTVNGPYWFPDADYDRTVPEFGFDPREARALLEAEGWRQNSKGVLEKDGREFRFKLLVIASELWRVPAVVIAEGALEAGVIIEVEAVPAREFGRIYRHDFDAFLVRNGLRPPVEPDQFELFHSSLADKQGNNWVGLRDERVDRLLEATQVTLDRSKRLRLRRQFHRLFNELQPFTVICCTYSPVGVGRRWANVKVHDLGLWFRDLYLRE